MATDRQGNLGGKDVGSLENKVRHLKHHDAYGVGLKV